jgi:uncharacterized protein (TIGR02271 family)
MLTQDQLRQVVGSTAYGTDGEKIGTVGQVFLDDQTGEPDFASVNTGLFGLNESLVPITQATLQGDRLTVPYSKEQVKDAPNVSVDAGHLDESEEARLYAHYGLETGAPVVETGTTDEVVETGTTGGVTEGYDTSGPTTDDAMTRSEERLTVGTTSQERGRARLRKYVTTEHETHTVPVRKEHAVLETEPITESNIDRATDGPTISEEEHEVVLHEERAVVEKTTEPVERVRLSTETEVEEQQVSEEVRKEHIELDDDTSTS